MNRKRFSESQILKILREKENGSPIQILIKKYGFSQATFYNWRAKYGGSNNLEFFRMNELEEENDKLKRMFAELSLEYLSLKRLLEKKEYSRSF
jgi:putative transposase